MTVPGEDDGLLSTFAGRRYSCRRCGVGGLQSRTTDPLPASLRFGSPDHAILLPRCEGCASPAEGPNDELDAEHALHAALGRAGADVDPVPLTPYRCSVAACALVWHELGVRPPMVPFYDVAAGMYRHPCPWCIQERPDVSRRDHVALARRLMS